MGEEEMANWGEDNGMKFDFPVKGVSKPFSLKWLLWGWIFSFWQTLSFMSVKWSFCVHMSSDRDEFLWYSLLGLAARIPVDFHSWVCGLKDSWPVFFSRDSVSFQCQWTLGLNHSAQAGLYSCYSLFTGNLQKYLSSHHFWYAEVTTLSEV